MFVKALKKAFGFTRPVVISTRTVDGTVKSAVATMILVNPEGWAITAGHVFDKQVKYSKDREKIAEAEKSGLEKDPEWITNHSIWWGMDGVVPEKAYVDRQVDLAVVKLKGFKGSSVKEYPVFRDPSTLFPGTSLCRLGFAFKEVDSSYDESKKAFKLAKGTLPLPFFPNAGMHTRNVMKGESMEKHKQLYVETSTPGFKGQSGGPIVDVDGMIYAMQVHTAHLSLDFHPMVEYNGEKMVENQVLNVGLGLHVETITKILDEKGINYNSETQGSQGERYVIN